MARREKILVPLGGSELSARILTQVRRLLIRRDAEVLLVRALSPQLLEQEKLPGEQLDLARRHLDATVASLRSEGANARSEAVVGEPAARLYELARSYRPPL